MRKKTSIDKIFDEMKSLLKSSPDLNRLVESLDAEIKNDEAEENIRIKLPYVSAQPTHEKAWVNY